MQEKNKLNNYTTPQWNMRIDLHKNFFELYKCSPLERASVMAINE